VTEPRIVSLIASATEIVCALGMEDHLVGRSHECDFPAAVKRLPQCTSPKFNVEGTSYEIDQRVKAVLQEALSVYRVDADRLERLQPTHIITQSQCEVCAVSLKDVEQAVCEFTSSHPTVVSLEPNALADIRRDIQRVADALEIPQRGRALNADLQGRMERIAEVARALDRRPRVALIEWIEPLMAAGNWMPELVDLAGGLNLFGEAGKHSPWMTWEELTAADPDVIVVAPCGFDLARTEREMYWLTERPDWERFRSRVYLADGNEYFNRPGPRVVETLEILSEILRPETVEPKHRGKAWRAMMSL
jgi:iron complex transport system substrate-binding protein